MATKGSKVWELPHRAPHFCDVPTGDRSIRSEVETESDTTLNHANFSWLKEDLSHLSLDVEVALLGADEEVAVSVAECSSVHAGVDHVDIECNALSDVWIATSGKRVQTVGKVNLLIILG